MSEEPTNTIVPAEPLTAEQAERLTLKIDLKLGIIADNRDAVMPLIREAIDREAYKASGMRQKALTCKIVSAPSLALESTHGGMWCLN